MAKRQRQSAPEPPAAAPAAASASGRPFLDSPYVVQAVALALVAIAYAGVWNADFVYDDKTQILQNGFIQDSRYFWTSMVRDVWAFHGDADQPWSNYWRPLFVAWLRLNYVLFAFEPSGWHVTSVLAHAVATLLAYRVALALGLTNVAAAFVTWVFAVHPAHVQSVAWVSGAPDVLMSAALFGSFLAYAKARGSNAKGVWAASLLLFAAGMLAKEVAIAFAPLVALVERFTWRTSWREAVLRAVPFAIVAVVYLAARALVLGGLRELAPFAPSLGGALVTAPAVLAFYLRQTFLPIWFGPVYGLRAPTAGTAGDVVTVVLSLSLLALAAFAGRRLARRNRAVAAAGLVWFLAFLAIALDVRVFVPELIVQDRYLYLPIFGAAVVASTATDRVRREAGYAIGGAVAVLLLLVSSAYAGTWANERALWERGVRIDPTSSVAYANLAEAYRAEGRLPEARDAAARALELNPDLTVANISMGAIEMRMGRFADAEGRLERVLDRYPDQAAALEQLCLAYAQQGKFDEAIRRSEEGIRTMPYNAARYGVNIAVLQRMSGRAAEARATLDSLRPAMQTSTDPDVLKGWWYLGELDREAGHADAAAASYREYLRATESIAGDPEVNGLRERIRSYGISKG